jgi:undecaprenyl-diphosphatase
VDFYEQLIQFDENLFLQLNGARNIVLDFVMPLFTNKKFWIPLYLLALGFAIKNYKGKKLLFHILAVLAAVGLADAVSVHLFKNVFERLRPCHVEHLKPLVHLFNNHCGGYFGFVSSHASNHMALAIVLPNLFCVERKKQTQLRYLLVFWALIIAYSRVYLGVHYPYDVIVGALLGASLGAGCLLGLKFLLPSR